MDLLALLIVGALLFVLLLKLNGMIAVLFLIAAVISIPALVLHRREAAATPQMSGSNEAEPHAMGLLRLARMIGLDTTGLVLGALLLILIAVSIVYLAGGPH